MRDLQYTQEQTGFYVVGRDIHAVPMLDQVSKLMNGLFSCSMTFHDRLQRVACLVGGRAAGLQLTSPKDTLCGQQWKAVPEVKLHLTTKL